jgi:hypothetical protein
VSKGGILPGQLAVLAAGLAVAAAGEVAKGTLASWQAPDDWRAAYVDACSRQASACVMHCSIAVELAGKVERVHGGLRPGLLVLLCRLASAIVNSLSVSLCEAL